MILEEWTITEREEVKVNVINRSVQMSQQRYWYCYHVCYIFWQTS